MSKPLSALAVALLLGTATATVAVVSTTECAYAGVRAAVGKPLQEALSLAASGNGSAALAKVREAESVGGLTAEEQKTIAQAKEYIAVKTGAGNANSAAGAKAKFASDYNAGRYHDVVGGDADLLRRFNAFDGNSQLIVAQAHYLMGDYSTAIHLLQGMGDSENVLSLIINAAAKTGDSVTERSAAERLILRGNGKYWPFLLGATERTRGLDDHSTLDIYRIRYLTGQLRNADDYLLLTTLLVQYGCPAEAVKVAQDGISKNVMTGDRANRLLKLAQDTASKDKASLDAEIAAAKKAATGDALVKMGEDLIGYGRAAEGVDLVKQGIAKGVIDKDGAQLTLGVVMVSAGQKDAAVRVLDAVKDPKKEPVAHLWSVYARSR